MTRTRLRAKAQRFGASGGDIRGCHVPGGGVAMVPLLVRWLWVKTLDHLLGLGGGGDVLRDARHPPKGVVEEPRFLPTVSRRHRRATLDPILKLLRFWHGTISLTSYSLHGSSLAPLVVLTVRRQDQCSTTERESRSAPQQQLGVSGSTRSDNLTKMRGSVSCQ